MAAAASIKIVKTIQWDGGVQEWSNRYHFDGAVPPDDTHWATLADAVVLAEKACFKSYVSIVSAVGYAGGSEVPVYSKAYSSQSGTGSWTGDLQAAEVAALVRFTTAKRTSKNHPVYLFNYYHGVCCTSSTAIDHLENTQKAALESYATSWITGYSDGAVTHHRAGPDSTLALTRLVEQYVTHRDFR